jgi:thioredoxin reductase (NADPH)
VLVIGGGNTAGQSAVYLSRFASEVLIIVRRDSLHETMSHYLVEQIANLPNVSVRTGMEVDHVEGEGRLERVWLRSCHNGEVIMNEAEALFVFIGSKPHSDWLPPNVLRNAKGFVLTGRDLLTEEEFPRIWKEPFEPLPLETSVAGLFAAGDVRAGAMNRVASAVGEGSMAIKHVLDYLGRT